MNSESPAVERMPRLAAILRDPCEPVLAQDATELIKDAGHCVRHGLAGVLLERAADLPIPLPAAFAEPFRASAMAAAAGNLHLLGELTNVLKPLNRANIPVMLLKGAALNLTLYPRADLRPMGDLDLLVHEADAVRAVEVLEQDGCRRGFSLISQDFFPKFHYEVELFTGARKPARIDLHARPFRPIRYARLIPDAALWHDAELVTVGDAESFVPKPEYMLIHLAAHAAFHGCARAIWLYDLKRFVDRHGVSLDWTLIVQRCREWQLSGAVARALATACDTFGNFVSREILDVIVAMRTTWQERMALAGTPDDARAPFRHVSRELLTIPGLRYRAEYLAAYLMPGAEHLREMYPHRHRGWRVAAHVWRAARLGSRALAVPLVLARSTVRAFIPASNAASVHHPVTVGPSILHGQGVIATRTIPAHAIVGRYSGTPCQVDGRYVISQMPQSGVPRERLLLAPPFRYLNHSDRPNARLATSEGAVFALNEIPAGTELTIDYGGDMRYCEDCGYAHAQRAAVTGARSVAVIMTVRNDAAGTAETLRSLACQTRTPLEIIVVDAGSTDGTRALLDSYGARLPYLRVLDAPGVNIARGRNLAINAARSEVIACTDAGCAAEPDWLARIVQPFEDDQQVEFVAGLYAIRGDTLLESVIGLATMRGQLEPVNPETFNPSARSVAFTRALWTRAGGWPEWIRFSEDTLFDRKVRSMGAVWRFAEDAVVAWRPRSTIRGVARQFFHYATGRGHTQLDAAGYRYNLRNMAVILVLASLALVSPWAMLPLAAAVLYFFGFAHHHRAMRVVRRTHRWIAYPMCLTVMTVVTLSGTLGYLVGALQRRRNHRQYRDQIEAYMQLPREVVECNIPAVARPHTPQSAKPAWAVS